MITLGWFLVVVGAIMTPLPPPFAFGIVILTIGLSILSAYSKGMRRCIQSTRYRYRRLSNAIEEVSPRLPRFVADAIRQTNPASLARLKRQQTRHDS